MLSHVIFRLARQLACEKYLCEKASGKGYGATMAMTGSGC